MLYFVPFVAYPDAYGQLALRREVDSFTSKVFFIHTRLQPGACVGALFGKPF